MSNIPEEVRKTDIHRSTVKLVDWLFGLPRFLRDRISFKADFDLSASFRISLKKSPTEVDDAGK